MRRVFSGLVLISLVTCSSTFAANVSNVVPAGSQKVQKPSRAARERQNNRQVSKARPDGRSEIGIAVVGGRLCGRAFGQLADFISSQIDGSRNQFMDRLLRRRRRRRGPAMKT